MDRKRSTFDPRESGKQNLSFYHNLIRFAAVSKRLPDHVQVKVQCVQAAPGIHAMSRVTFSIETAFLLEDIITSSKSIRLQVVHHCFGSFIVHTMKKIK